MANTIKLKRASGSDPGNSDLSVGELAIRTSNCKLFSKNDGGSAVGIVAGSADTLTTARTIAGVSFDGSGNISLNNNAITNGAGYIADVVSDTSPQLGGDLDVQSSKITTATSNGNVKIEPNGTGVVEVRGAGGNDGKLQLNCSAQSHGIKLASPAHSAGQSYTLIFPDNQIAADKYIKIKSISGSGATAIGQAEYASLDANDLGEGTIPDARFPSTLPSGVAVATANINDDAVTYAKIQNVSATNRILGRDSSGAGVIEEITPANLRTMINVEDGATADQTNSEIAAALSDQRPSMKGADFTDDGTGSPIVHIKGDDGNPWALIIGNDSYSTGTHGLRIYLDNNGSVDSRISGNSEYRTWNIKQDNGSTVRSLVTLSNDGSVYLRHQGDLKLGTSSSGVSVTGTCTATTFSGSGASLTSLPAGNLTGTLPAIDGSNLTGISAGATGGGSDEIFYENGQTVTTDYTITNGKNAMSAGPITIDSGVTVTVGAGETLTIV